MARRGSVGSAVGTIVLVMFLVFFILLSIGLGVTTYLGFAQDDSKDNEIKKQKANFADMEKQRDYYRFQALVYRVYMDPTQNPDAQALESGRGGYENGSVFPKDQKDRDEIKAFVTALDTKLGWDSTKKRPKKTYEELLTAEKKRADDAVAQSELHKKQKDNEAAQVLRLQGDLAAAKDAHRAEFEAFKNKANADLKKAAQENDELKTKVTELSEQFVALQKSADDDKRKADKLAKDKDTEIAKLMQRLAVKDEAIASLRKELRGDVPTALKLDWKVIRTDSRGETAFINLGSADKVQPQLTFRVHGIGPDGRPLPKDKAWVEVLNVLGEHLSQAKINYVTLPRDKPRHDPRHDPVVAGDILINPSWDPHQKKHVAIAGVVDLTGDGRDDTEQFVRGLERQNIVVDAYLDLRKDFTIKGPGITVNTDYLVLGEEPADVLGAQGREAEIKAKIKEAMSTIRRQAAENGVKVIGLRRYLDEIGFRIPGNPEEKKPVVEYKGDGGLPPQVPKEPMPPKEPPAPPKEPMKKDDKPAPPPP